VILAFSLHLVVSDDWKIQKKEGKNRVSRPVVLSISTISSCMTEEFQRKKKEGGKFQSNCYVFLPFTREKEREEEKLRACHTTVGGITSDTERRRHVSEVWAPSGEVEEKEGKKKRSHIVNLLYCDHRRGDRGAREGKEGRCFARLASFLLSRSFVRLARRGMGEKGEKEKGHGDDARPLSLF